MPDYVLQSWLLAPLYLGGVALAFLVAYFVGAAWPALEPARNAYFPPAYPLLRRIALGMAMVSFTASLLGTVALLTLAWPVLLIVALYGLSRAHHTRDLSLALNSIRHVHKRLRRFPFGSRMLAYLPIGAFGVLSINAILGGLSPPMGHDAMWYHLAVPRQWTFSVRIDAYPDIMPSNYPLAGNTLYALLLQARGNAALCNVFYAASGVLLLLTMIAVTGVLTSRFQYPARNWIAAFVCLAVWVPVVARESLIAPTMAQNDIFAMLWLAVGYAELWSCSQRTVRIRSLVTAGFLLGTAAAAKLVVVMAVAVSPLVPLLIACRIGPGQLHRFLPSVLVSLGLCIGYFPWALRAALTNGMPLFPLLSSLFPPSPDYAIALRASHEWNGLLAPGRTGLAGAWHNLTYKLSAAASTGASGVYMFAVLASVGTLLLRGSQRVYCALLLLFTMALVLMQGGLEVLRYFSLYFPLAAPALAWITLDLLHRIRRPALPIIAAVSLLTYGGYAVRQLIHASHPIFDYRYRPVLSDVDLRRRAHVTELGLYYLGHTAWQSRVPHHARVFLPDSHFPFYLDRDTLWNDLATQGGVADRWKSMTQEEAEEFLEQMQIDAVLYTKLPPTSVPLQLRSGLAQGTIREVPPPADSPPGWRLFVRGAERE